MRNKKIILLVILAILLITTGVFFAKTKSFFKKETPAQTTAQAPVQAQPQQEIPDAIKAIMDNHVTGTVTAINAKTITLQVGNEAKTYNLGSFTFVLQTKGTIENKKLSDIKTGASVYLHFEKDTSKALDITIL